MIRVLQKSLNRLTRIRFMILRNEAARDDLGLYGGGNVPGIRTRRLADAEAA